LIIPAFSGNASKRRGIFEKNEEQIEEALKRVAAWEKSHPHTYKKFPFNELD
jgi:hypothetical protein